MKLLNQKEKAIDYCKRVFNKDLIEHIDLGEPLSTWKFISSEEGEYYEIKSFSNSRGTIFICLNVSLTFLVFESKFSTEKYLLTFVHLDISYRNTVSLFLKTI